MRPPSPYQGTEVVMIDELTEDVRTTVAQLLLAYDEHLAGGGVWGNWEHDRFFLTTEVSETFAYQMVIGHDSRLGVIAWEDGDGDEPFFAEPTSRFRPADAARAIIDHAGA